MRQRLGRARAVGAVALVAVVAALLLDSRFVTPEELAAAGPERFDPEATAQEIYDRVPDELLGGASPLGEVVTAVQADLTAAAEEFDAVKPDDTTYIFAVRATGTVTDVNGRAASIRVEGVPQETSVSVALGPAISGTVLRDAMGFSFADAPTQSAFQSVGDQLKALMQADVGEPPRRGSEVTVEGVLSVTDTGSPQSPQKPVSIQPVTVEVAP